MTRQRWALMFPIIAGSVMGILASLYDLRAATLGGVIFIAMLVYSAVRRLADY